MGMAKILVVIMLVTSMASTKPSLVLLIDKTQCWNCTTSTPQVGQVDIANIELESVSIFNFSHPVKIRWQELMRLW